MKISTSIIALLLAVVIVNLSCKNNEKAESGVPAVDSTALVAPAENAATIDPETSTSKSDCDKFLSEYENYSMEYLSAVKKYATDPTNQSFLSEFTRYSQKMQQWSERWKNLGADCVNDASFFQKYLNITNRITEAATKMYQ